MTARRFYVYAFFLFLIDIFLASFLQRYIIYGLLCFYAWALFEPVNQTIISFLIVLIFFEQFIMQGHFGLLPLYLLPVSASAFKTKHLFYSHRPLPLIFIIFCLITQIFIIEPLICGVFDGKIYTIEKLFANIILMSLFSLKFKSTKS